MKRYVCIHGHFYQPPRENPWLEKIELQDSAYPYSDWNERIVSECYAPNASSRILDSKNNIIDIVNNYAKMSFNFGPTLLSWMQKSCPELYRAILAADKLSQNNFSGHGAAIAQAYNHMILPLANERDRRTQTIWGIKDFEARFNRPPEGMWLPETAVDIPTLEVLAEFGIHFTILAPGQAKHVRRIGAKDWKKVKDAGLDTQQPYFCRLPSGREISIFFYDGPVAHDIAFGDLLNNGEGFANRLVGVFPAKHRNSKLVHVATDGETYGHHHRFGNMALSYCLHYLEENGQAIITVYSEFLKKYPPKLEVEIHENSSWSCSHGIERWRDDCGCCIGTNVDWDQKWRKPLRDALDWLRDKLAVIYEHEVGHFCNDPWMARDEYVSVILNRSIENADSFFGKIKKTELSKDDKIKILKLMEMQRNAMLMYTSCGWFFDDISGIESVQILEYAARAIQLAQSIISHDLENEFIEKLESAPSNVLSLKNGAEIYKRRVKPSIVDFLHVGAHYAISSFFEKYPESAEIYSYTVKTSVYQLHEVGSQKLVVGRAAIRSNVTWEECNVDFVALHFGDYNFNGDVRYHRGDDDFNEMMSQVKGAFLKNDISETIRLMNHHFGEHTYSLWDLFRNEQGKVLNQIFEKTLENIEANFREVYEHYYPLMQIKPDFRVPLPKALSMTAEFILNRDLVDVFENDILDIDKLRRLAKEIKRWSFSHDKETLSFKASQRIDKMMTDLFNNPESISMLKTICEVFEIIEEMSLDLDLWRVQNTYFSMTRNVSGVMRKKAGSSDLDAKQWVKYFDKLGHYLKIKIF